MFKHDPNSSYKRIQKLAKEDNIADVNFGYISPKPIKSYALISVIGIHLSFLFIIFISLVNVAVVIIIIVIIRKNRGGLQASTSIHRLQS